MLDSERNNHETDDNQARGQAQTDNSAGGTADNGADGGPGPAGTGTPAGVPPTVFQAPQVLFQPPAPVAPAAPPSSSSPPPAESGGGRSGRGSRGSRGQKADSGQKADGGQKADADAADETSGRAADAEPGPETSGDGDEGAGRRRRRRNGRSRGRSADATESSDAESAVSAPDEAGAKAADSAPASDSGPDDSDSGPDSASDSDDEDGEGAESSAGGPESASSRRRRRKRRRGGSGDGDVAAPDDPPDTVVHVRDAHDPADDVRAIKGSTRLEAKKQRRREGRESGRRRTPVVTESEFLARRESVERTMVVRQRGDRTQIAVLEDGVLVEHYVNRTTHQSYVGNVYLGKVQNVLPSMEAAFVDIGKGRNAVLYAGEVNFDASGLEGQPKRIESALKPGQSVIVQVTKDPVGHKGARLTSQISLPGRYLVYVPGASMTGISRKLPDTERNRLKHILKKVTPENAGVIVRTAAEGAAEAELDRDVTRLAAQWETIERKAKTASAPALLYGEPDLTIRVVRDVFNEDFSKLIVSGDEGWDTIDEYVRYVAPHLAERLSRWEGDDADSGDGPVDDVFGAYRIDEQLAKALERKVWLPSGGSLVIDRTEAMTVIDVNTGKFTGQGGNLEETVTRNNLEAAEEIVRQLRLRDVGGIVVIDFIDMVLESNRELVLRRLLECLARDRTKHQVAEVTSLGLVQMTRKRVGAGLLEAFSQPCECCNGRGLHVTLEPTELSHRSSAGHSGGSGTSRRSGRSGGADTEDRSERGGRRGKRDGRGAGSMSKSAVSSAAASAAKVAAASAASVVSAASAAVADAPLPSGASSVPEPALADDATAVSEPGVAAEGSAASDAGGQPAGESAGESAGQKRSVPSVSAWAVSTSPADDSPVTVSVSVPSGAEPAVVDEADSAPPVRRTRTRAGSAVARKAEAPVESASAAQASVTEAEPETAAEPAAEAVVPAADAVPAAEAVPAADAVPATEAEKAPAAAPAEEDAPVAEAAPAEEPAPEEVAPVAGVTETQAPVTETEPSAADAEPPAAETSDATDMSGEPGSAAPEPEQPEPSPEAPASPESATATDAATEETSAPEAVSAQAPSQETDAETAPEPGSAEEPASAEEPPANDGFPFWS